MAERFLAIYMNDQLASGLVWREMARRAAGENEGSPLGDVLGRVATEIAEDIETFRVLMRRLGIAESRVKPRLAIAAERAARLKPNGRLRSYSPLSRFAELDFLAIGIEGKVILWENLRDFAGLGERLAEVDFGALAARARAQRDSLEPFRAEAGRAALR